jgi:CBS domain-containing protein
MALPQMNSDPTAVDRAPGAHEVTTTTTICEARAQLHITGESAAVVYRNGRPVVVVTAAALATAALASARMAGRADAPIGTVMDYVAVPVDRQADAMETVRVFDHAAWDWLKRRARASRP